MQRVVRDDHRTVEPELIEQRAIGSQAGRLVPPEPADPARLRLSRGLIRERVAQLLLRTHSGEICPNGVERRNAQVVVRVDEAREQCPTLQIAKRSVRKR